MELTGVGQGPEIKTYMDLVARWRAEGLIKKPAEAEAMLRALKPIRVDESFGATCVGICELLQGRVKLDEVYTWAKEQPDGQADVLEYLREHDMGDIADSLRKELDDLGIPYAGGQHRTQVFNVESHTLVLLANIDLKELSPKDREVLILASIFHDIGKPEGKVDRKHPKKSAEIINQYTFSDEEVKRRVLFLVEYHDGIIKYNKESASFVLVENLPSGTTSADLDILRRLKIADSQAVNPGYASTWTAEKVQEIETAFRQAAEAI